MASIRSIKRNKKRHQFIDPYAEFEEELAHDPSFKDTHIVRNPRGEAKMSEVLETLVQPFEDFANTYEARKMLMTLGIAAWNVALLPTEEQNKAIDDLLAAVEDVDKRDKEVMKDMIVTLIARKQSLFADNKRYILSYKLTDQGNNWHLSVVSTPSKQP